MDRKFKENIFYNPEKCGFELIKVLDEKHMSYEFNTFIVLKDLLTGELYCAYDCGCSCPIPFESYTMLSSLTRIIDSDELFAEFKSWNDQIYDKNDAYTDIDLRIYAEECFK